MCYGAVNNQDVRGDDRRCMQPFPLMLVQIYTIMVCVVCSLIITVPHTYLGMSVAFLGEKSEVWLSPIWVGLF